MLKFFFAFKFAWKIDTYKWIYYIRLGSVDKLRYLPMTDYIIVLITTLNYETRSDIFEVKIINHLDLLLLIQLI